MGNSNSGRRKSSDSADRTLNLISNAAVYADPEHARLQQEARRVTDPDGDLYKDNLLDEHAIVTTSDLAIYPDLMEKRERERKRLEAFKAMIARDARIREAVAQAWAKLPRRDQQRAISTAEQTDFTKWGTSLPTWAQIEKLMQNTRPMTPKGSGSSRAGRVR